MSKVFHIVWQAFTRLRARPLYTSMIVLSLALGIGANSAIFSVVNTLFLHPLVVQDVDRLVFTLDMRNGDDAYEAAGVDYVAFRKQMTSFAAMGGARRRIFRLLGRERPEQLEGAAVSADYFSTLGISPVLGRSFTAEDDKPGSGTVVILNYGLWQRNFGSDRNLIGQQLTLGERTYTVVGVMPKNFDLPLGTQLWVPLATDIEAQPVPEQIKHFFFMVGRLKPGISREQANTEAHAVALRLQQDFPQWRRNWDIALIPLRQQILGDIDGHMRPVIYLVVFIVGFLLLITCANVATLLLVRSLERSHEVAVQMALGASRARLLSQLLAESLLLSLSGGAVGLLLADFATRLFAIFKPVSAFALKSVVEHVQIDGGVLLFTFIISLFTGILFGLAPMFHAASPGGVVSGLRQGGQRGGLGTGGRRLLNVLTTSEIVITMVLLVGAGLMIRNLQQLNNTRLGFRKDHLLTMQMFLQAEDYPNQQKRADFVKSVVERVRVLPGVLSAGITTNKPLDQATKDSPFSVEGRPPIDASEVPATSDRVVTPGYLEMMNVALLRGRFLTEQDRADTLPVVVVSREFARQSWGQEDPIGKRVKLSYPPDPDSPWITVVGLVDDVKEDRFNFRIDRPVWYMPYAQRDLNVLPVSLVVLCSVEPDSLTGSVLNVISSVNKHQPVSNIVTVEEYVGDFLSPQRFSALLGGIFAGLGLVLAAIGIYSVTSYSVTQRTREFGIRLALGAQWSDLIRLILRDGLRQVGVGLGIGLLCSFVLNRLISGLLYQVGPAAPGVLAGTVATLALAAIMAMYMPTRRIAEVNPSRVLRYE